ncbi:hypothetical protein QBC36DRAFT_362796 [Triangularia setosa]|uniref:Rhodopsin domain-containing protein n=1 Tax=Triangularia setosa TaxID=2587417 RepID=A0AAN7A206_9PEZI|nr:hypothetical protein QBC36DRAFT_362796 [Podospora setosa]
MRLLIFVMRTFGIHKWLRWTGYFFHRLHRTVFLYHRHVDWAHCSSGLHTVDIPFMFNCVNATYYTVVLRNSVSLFVDVIIFIQPLPFVVKFKLSRRKKIGVALVFLNGGFGIIAAVCCTFLIVSCAPALRLFWSHYFGKSAFATRLGLGDSMTEGSSKNSQQPIKVTTDHYVELHDAAQAPTPAYTSPKVKGQWASRQM